MGRSPQEAGYLLRQVPLRINCFCPERGRTDRLGRRWVTKLGSLGSQRLPCCVSRQSSRPHPLGSVLRCCVTNAHRHGSLEQHMVISSQIPRVRSLAAASRVLCLGSQTGCSQGDGRSVSFLERRVLSPSSHGRWWYSRPVGLGPGCSVPVRWGCSQLSEAPTLLAAWPLTGRRLTSRPTFPGLPW